jgi:signal transduction histidine kinase
MRSPPAYDPPGVRFDGAFHATGYVLLAAAGLPAALEPHNGINRKLVAWIAAYVVFGLAFHVGARAPQAERRRRLLGLGIMIPSMLAMAAILPCLFQSLSLVIVASQAALVFSPRWTAVLIGAQSIALGFFLIEAGDLREGVVTMFALVAGESFAAVAVHTARREAEARSALTATNAELRATRSLLEEASRVNERTRIARELHDVLGHDLTALSLQLEVAMHVPPEAGGVHLAKAKEVSSRLLRNVREVVSAMRATPDPDLASALRTLIDGVPGLKVHLSMPEVVRVDDGSRGQCIVRCVQEILTNTLRHAGATNLWIAITQHQDAVIVEARDDGRGASEVRAGHGLSGMRARLEELGGSLKVSPEPSRDFVVSAWLPLRGSN